MSYVLYLSSLICKCIIKQLWAWYEKSKDIFAFAFPDIFFAQRQQGQDVHIARSRQGNKQWLQCHAGRWGSDEEVLWNLKK